jgi:hypothetical protein
LRVRRTFFHPVVADDKPSLIVTHPVIAKTAPRAATTIHHPDVNAENKRNGACKTANGRNAVLTGYLSITRPTISSDIARLFAEREGTASNTSPIVDEVAWAQVETQLTVTIHVTLTHARLVALCKYVDRTIEENIWQD